MRSLASTFLAGRTHTISRILALCGPVSAAVFALTNIIFIECAADGDSCGKQWMSRLGATGAPHASVFNLFCFILPGLLVVALAAGLKREFRIFTAPTFLGLCGGSLTVVGLFPLGFSLSDNLIHTLAAHLCGLSFVVAAVLLSIPMRENSSFVQLSRLTRGLVFLLILNAALQLAWAPQGFLPPGWNQRLNFLGYFAWISFAGLSLFISTRNSTMPRRPFGLHG